MATTALHMTLGGIQFCQCHTAYQLKSSFGAKELNTTLFFLLITL
jgi:hypothetical protein